MMVENHKHTPLNTVSAASKEMRDPSALKMPDSPNTNEPALEPAAVPTKSTPDESIFLKMVSPKSESDSIESLERIERLELARDLAEQEAAKYLEFVTTQTLLSSSNYDLDEILELVVTRLSVLTSASASSIELIEGDELILKSGVGFSDQYLGAKLSLRNSLSGLSVRQGRLLDSPEVLKDPRADKQLAQALDIKSLMVAPLYCAGSPVGALKIMSHKPHAFKPEDAKSLAMMAGVVGSAIGRQIQLEQSERLLMDRSIALARVAEAKLEIEREKELLAEQEKRMRLILETSRDAFVVMNQEGFVTDWNRQAEVLFGWSRLEAIGKALVELVIPERERARMDQERLRFLETGGSSLFNERQRQIAIRRDGQEFPMELSFKALETQNGWEFCAFLQDISIRAEAEEEMLRQARSDQLTGLPNRKAFDERLVTAMERSRRSKNAMALMYLDIDFFKSINDTLGHLAGDDALTHFAMSAKSKLRSSDTIARLGGDEFAAIFEDLKTPADAALIAEKIMVSAREEVMIGGEALRLSISAGLAFFHGEEITTQMLIDKADQALYQVKREGRNGFRVNEDDVKALGVPAGAKGPVGPISATITGSARK